jgi:hypothetical protein
MAQNTRLGSRVAQLLTLLESHRRHIKRIDAEIFRLRARAHGGRGNAKSSILQTRTLIRPRDAAMSANRNR